MRNIGNDNNDNNPKDNVFEDVVVTAMTENVSIINRLYVNVIHI